MRDERLGEASELQNFLQKLDHFQTWLTKTQNEVATEDFPVDLADAERLLNQHEQVKDEMKGYEPQYHELMDYGQKVVEGQDDPQYMFLREVRLYSWAPSTCETFWALPVFMIKATMSFILFIERLIHRLQERKELAKENEKTYLTARHLEFFARHLICRAF